MAKSGFNWKGEQVKAKIVRASIEAINEVMSSASAYAKENHPGWVYRTGTAERSIRPQILARRSGRGVAGHWGSVGTDYMKWLELKYGSALRNAADAKYRDLAGAIRRRLR